jgi:tetratricopeptide (TPR) repeat protein
MTARADRPFGAHARPGPHWLSRATMALALALAPAVPAAAAKDEASGAVAEKIATATEEVAYVNLDKARGLFAAARAMTKPGSPAWETAIFGEATCTWHLLPITRENAENARRLFAELVERSPHGKATPRAMMNLGRILELPEDRDDPVDLPGARRWYEKVIDTWPADPIAGEATMRTAGTYIQTFEEKAVRHGVELLRKWVEGHPTDPLASIMWQYLADTYFFPIKDYQRALEAYDRVDALGWTEKGLQGPYYWRIAQMSERFLKNRDASVKYYTKIITETPNSGKAYESELGLRRLGAPIPESQMMKFLGESSPGAGAAPKDRGNRP